MPEAPEDPSSSMMASIFDSLLVMVVMIFANISLMASTRAVKDESFFRSSWRPSSTFMGSSPPASTRSIAQNPHPRAGSQQCESCRAKGLHLSQNGLSQNGYGTYLRMHIYIYIYIEREREGEREREIS